MPRLQLKKDNASNAPAATTPAPGSRGLQLKKSGPYVQQKDSVRPGGSGYDDQRAASTPGADSLQLKGGPDAAAMHEAAESGVAGGGGALPHADAIQNSFGGHDVSGIGAHVGGAAKDANEAMGAEAYASGEDVAFKETPDLHTTAHEAAHIVQQRSGVSLKDGIGAEGDSYEQNADAVADRVVAGQSAEDLLPGSGAAASGDVQAKKKGSVQAKKGKAVQRLGDRLDEEATGDNKPPEYIEHAVTNDDNELVTHRDDGTAYGSAGENKNYKGEVDQRRYTFGQYQKMWEKDKGRKMTADELSTLKRGCIGITVLNLNATGSPPFEEAYNTFEQAEVRLKDIQKIIEEHPNATAAEMKADATMNWGLNFQGKLGDFKAALYAKLFWSNQKKEPNQADFQAGEHQWNEEHVWKKEPMVLPNGMTVDQMLADKGRDATVEYINFNGEEVKEEDKGKILEPGEYNKLADKAHSKNVSAYYLAWARAMKEKDPKAFPVDETTGKVDMTGYMYLGQPKIKKDKDTGEDEYAGGFVNFDYGFWDESTQTFWHANHMQYPEKREDGTPDERHKKQPMIVLQSTRAKFAKGYRDFDRIIYAIGLQKNYKPDAHANTHG